MRTEEQEVISYELDVAASIELEPMDDQAVGSPLDAYDPTSQADITAQDDIDSAYPPPGFSRGQAPFARSYEDPQQLAAAAPPPTLTLDTDEEVEDVRIPPRLRPKSKREAEYLLQHMVWDYGLQRGWARRAYEDIAWSIHHWQNETGVNQYCNTKAFAGVLAQVELEDHESGRIDMMDLPTWARAEHRWALDYPEYNEYVRENAEKLINKPAPGAEADEELDLMDDVLLMDEEGTDAGDQEDDDEAGLMLPQGLDSFLVGVLPGTGGGDELGQEYLDDVLGAGGGDDDDFLDEDL